MISKIQRDTLRKIDAASTIAPVPEVILASQNKNKDSIARMVGLGLIDRIMIEGRSHYQVTPAGRQMLAGAS